MYKFKLIFLLVLSLTALAVQAQSSVTDEEALALGHRVERVTNSGSAAELSRLLDMDAFIDNIRKKSKALQDPAFLKGFKDGVSKSMGNLGPGLASTAVGGSYHLLREYDKDGQKHLLFRAFGKNGLNYHDYTLVKIKDSVRASDIYIYTVDEELSGTMATLVETMNGDGSTDNLSNQAHILVKLKNYNQQKQYGEAKDTYDKLDADMRSNKMIQVIYIDICRHLNDTLYQKALEDFANAFPEATSSYLMMIDFYYLKKDFAKGIAALDKLDKIVGKDPFLDFYRGNFCMSFGKKEESLPYYQNVYKYDPEMAPNTRQLIRACARDKRTDEAKTVIARYKTTSGFKQADLDAIYTSYPSLK